MNNFDQQVQEQASDSGTSIPCRTHELQEVFEHEHSSNIHEYH